MFRNIHTDFHICEYILLEEPANFNREKGSVAFVTGHWFTFLVVLSLSCLVTTQILICENQTIRRLEILLRTIVVALFKTKISRNGQGIFHNSANDRERWGLLILCCQSNIWCRIMPTQPTLRLTNTHAHQQKGQCLLNDLCPSQAITWMSWLQKPFDF